MEGIQDATSANSLVEAVTKGGGDGRIGNEGGDGESASGFGLGVGFALSPELAQKVKRGGCLS